MPHAGSEPGLLPGTAAGRSGAALTCRPMHAGDWPAVWPILEEAFRAGDSYPCPRDITEADARRYWTEPGLHMPKWTYVGEMTDGDAVAEESSRRATGTKIAGTFYIRTDQGGPGDHVCNAGFVTARDHRKRGIAQAMCRWAQDEARRLGFSAMRFNLVVASNAPALRAWTRCGMEHIGTTPRAFRLPSGTFADAHILYRLLD